MIGWFGRRLRNYIDRRVDDRFRALFDEALARNFADRERLTNNRRGPNINEVWRLAKDLDAMRNDLRLFGNDLAYRVEQRLAARKMTEPQRVGLRSKAATQADLESDWLAYWAGALGVQVIVNRKLWEYFFILQVLWEQGCLEAGKKGIGFGCGDEPLPSCMAARNVDVLVTDLGEVEQRARDWGHRRQTLDTVFHPAIVDRSRFDRHVSLAIVDMNAIPDSLGGYDFCWSACALEHLGSIELGLAFAERSLDTLKPGGVAVHTAEFNYANDTETIDNWATVLFQKRHLTEFADRLRAKGHWVAELDFDLGTKPLDRFIGLPPVRSNVAPYIRNGTLPHDRFLRVNLDGFATTSFGLIVRKLEEA